MALPADTASTEASGSGIASALPDRARTAGSERRGSVSIAASGSTAMTSVLTGLPHVRPDHIPGPFVLHACMTGPSSTEPGQEPESAALS
ncbi:hypothetical protein [Streptomyces sp. NPDC088812]|uniref:hypothetical protein n=1 Tax=Streptomyces sp. NPDC088812 TaxID=3365905 RepID=UPI003822B28D